MHNFRSGVDVSCVFVSTKKTFCDFPFVVIGSNFREPFPVPKSIQPDKIIAMISRGLAVNCMTLSKNLITDNVALGALLPQIHVTLFGVLDKLIVV